MDGSTIFSIGISGVTATIGWLARQLWTAVQDLKAELNTLKVEIGTNYVRYDRLKDMLEPIMESLRDIQITLKDKADK